MHSPRASQLSFVLAALFALPAAATRYHVDADAAPGGDGLSWATAFDSLDDAVALLQAGDRVWLAEGTYTPGIEEVPGDPRSATFLFPADTRLYGGFAGNELTLADRAGLFDTTVLSGEVGLSVADDNVYHVLTVRHPSGIPPGGNRVDGLVVRAGNAVGGSGQGGGVLAFNVGLRLENVTVERNQAFNGGGVHAQPGALNLLNCVLRDNKAFNNGGGLWGQAVQLRVFNTRFESNAALSKGGGVFVHSSSGVPEAMVFGNAVFHDNLSSNGGAAFVGGGQFSYGAATFKSCTFAANHATLKGGAVRANTAPTLPAQVFLHNSILWDNSAPEGAGLSGRALVTFSNMQDRGYAGQAGNLSGDPGFVDLAARDLRLAAGSPCVDAGSDGQLVMDYLDLDHDGLVFESVPVDHDGLRRKVDDPAAPDTGLGRAPLADMGAYERAP